MKNSKDKFPVKKGAKFAKPEKFAKSKASRKSSDDDEGDDFVSDDVVGSGGNSYFKPESGDNKIRIISKPIVGWLAWVEDEEGNKMPVRTPIDDEPNASDFEKDNKPKKFMTVVIIDHEDDGVKIWEITQQGIIKAIKALTSNKDWGNPFSYDLNISKKGEGKKTKYAVTPSPKKALSKDLIKAAEAKPCFLGALFQDEDNNPWAIDEVDESDLTEYFFK